jgi:hypothetical protein
MRLRISAHISWWHRGPLRLPRCYCRRSGLQLGPAIPAAATVRLTAMKLPGLTDAESIPHSIRNAANSGWLLPPPQNSDETRRVTIRVTVPER